MSAAVHKLSGRTLPTDTATTTTEDGGIATEDGDGAAATTEDKGEDAGNAATTAGVHDATKSDDNATTTGDHDATGERTQHDAGNHDGNGADEEPSTPGRQGSKSSPVTSSLRRMELYTEMSAWSRAHQVMQEQKLSPRQVRG